MVLPADTINTNILPGSNLDRLAKDIAILTANNLYSVEEVIDSYGITPYEYENLTYTRPFQERLSHHQKEIGTDRNALLRAQAKLMTDANLRSLHEMANDPKTKPSDRLKAAALIMELADAKPKQEQQFSGMVLNVSFGSGTPAVGIISDDVVDATDTEGGLNG